MTHSAAGQPDHDGDLDADPHPPSLSQSWPPPPPQAPTWAPQPQLRLISQRGEQAEASPQAAPLRSLGLTRPSITSDLDSELQAAREELHALHELLEELPSIFERKFQHRLQSALQDQKRLLSANQELHQQLARALPHGSIPVSKPTSRLMLPPALERAGTLGQTLRQVLRRQREEDRAEAAEAKRDTDSEPTAPTPLSGMRRNEPHAQP